MNTTGSRGGISMWIHDADGKDLMVSTANIKDDREPYEWVWFDLQGRWEVMTHHGSAIVEPSEIDDDGNVIGPWTPYVTSYNVTEWGEAEYPISWHGEDCSDLEEAKRYALYALLTSLRDARERINALINE